MKVVNKLPLTVIFTGNKYRWGTNIAVEQMLRRYSCMQQNLRIIIDIAKSYFAVSLTRWNHFTKLIYVFIESFFLSFFKEAVSS